MLFFLSVDQLLFGLYFQCGGKMWELSRMMIECGKRYETKTVIGNLKAAPIFTLKT